MLQEEYKVDITLSKSDFWFLILILISIAVFNAFYFMNSHFYDENGTGKYIQSALILMAVISAFGRSFHHEWKKYDSVYFGAGVLFVIILLRYTNYGYLFLGSNINEIYSGLFNIVSIIIDISCAVILLAAGGMMFINKKSMPFLLKIPDMTKIKHTSLLFMFACGALILSAERLLFSPASRFHVMFDIQLLALPSRFAYLEVLISIIFVMTIYLINTKPKKL